MRASHFRRETANEKKTDFNGTVVNRALPSLHKGLLEITLTAPLGRYKTRNIGFPKKVKFTCAQLRATELQLETLV